MAVHGGVVRARIRLAVTLKAPNWKAPGRCSFDACPPHVHPLMATRWHVVYARLGYLL